MPARLTSLATLVLVVLAIGLAVPDGVDAAAVTIRITDRVEPAELRVAPGTTVRWVNRDDERHRMRSQSGPDEFDSGNLEPGESFAVTLSAAGTYTYLDERDDDDLDYHGRIVVADDGTDDGPATTPGGAATARVGMAGRTFSPGSVTIAAGATVTFDNDDDDEHTATATDGSWDTGSLGSGSSEVIRFETPGEFAFLCVFHPEMTGTVVVQGAAPDGPADPAAPATPTPSATPSTPSGSDVLPPQTVEASIVDFAFEPAALEVEAGTTVTWRNDGVAPHTVTDDAGAFDSGSIAAGATWSHRFEAPGSYAFVCVLHPEMTGTIQVAAGPGDAPGDASASGDAPGSTLPSATAPAARSAPAAGSAPPGDPAGAAGAAGGMSGPSVEPTASSEPVAAAAMGEGGGAAGLPGIVLAAVLVLGGSTLFLRTIAGAVHRE